MPGGDVNGLYYQCLDSNLVWREQSVLTGQNEVAGLVQMATDNSSWVALAWEYSGTNQFWVNLREGCSEVSQIPIPFPNSPVLDIKTIALSKEPMKFCAIAKQRYTSNYYVHCAYNER